MFLYITKYYILTQSPPEMFKVYTNTFPKVMREIFPIKEEGQQSVNYGFW